MFFIIYIENQFVLTVISSINFSNVSMSTCVNGAPSNVVTFISSKNKLLLSSTLFSASNLSGLSECSKILVQTGVTNLFSSSYLESKSSTPESIPPIANQFDN